MSANTQYSGPPIYPIAPLEYTPQAPKQQPSPPVEYALVKDVTGKPPVLRGPQVLTDARGHKVKVPFPPNSKCKKCYGRGYVGYDVKSKLPMPCRKCYPMNKQ
jgi:hypothetical protein